MTNVMISKQLDQLLVPIDPQGVEKLKNATFVGEFCLRDKYGNWVNDPAQIYWQEKPPVEGYSNYFALFVRNSQVFITSGQAAADAEISAIGYKDEIIFSRYRHDYRSSTDGAVAIDGGRDYTKIVGTPDEYLTLKIEGPHLVIKERALFSAVRQAH